MIIEHNKGASPYTTRESLSATLRGFLLCIYLTNGL